MYVDTYIGAFYGWIQQKQTTTEQETMATVTAGDKIPNNAVLKFPIYQG